MGVERLDQLGEVGERAGQPIDLYRTTITSIRFACTSMSSFCRAGRSIDPPEKPPSSYRSRTSRHGPHAPGS